MKQETDKDIQIVIDVPSWVKPKIKYLLYAYVKDLCQLLVDDTMTVRIVRDRQFR